MYIPITNSTADTCNIQSLTTKCEAYLLIQLLGGGVVVVGLTWVVIYTVARGWSGGSGLTFVMSFAECM